MGSPTIARTSAIVAAVDLMAAALSQSPMLIAAATAATKPKSVGSCVAYKREYANGSTLGCPVKPGAGVVCPLGLGFTDGRAATAAGCRTALNPPSANQLYRTAILSPRLCQGL
jgi:hypothetical protein